MKIRFNLHKPSEKESLIYVIVSHQGKTLANWSTGKRALSGKWDVKKGRAQKSHPNYKTLNAVLDKINIALNDAHHECLLAGHPLTKNDLRVKFDEVLQKKAHTEETTFFGFFDKFIQERTNSPDFSYNTVKQYKAVRNRLQRFNGRADWQDINLAFFARLIDSMTAEEMQQSSIHKVLRIIRTVLNDAKSRGLPVNPEYEMKQARVKMKKNSKIYLTEDELEKLAKAKLTGRLERVRDLALVAAYTGQRYSDLHKINRKNLIQHNGHEMFKFRTTKSGGSQEVAVPIYPVVSAMLEKYDWKLPIPSNQKFNAYIKEACKVAGIKEKVIVTTYPGGEIKTTTKAKHELVKAHTFRHSFITNRLLEGLSPALLKDIVGHVKIDTTMLYDVKTKEQSAEAVQAHIAKTKSSRHLRRIG